MPKFKVTITLPGFIIEVEADNKDKAADIAESQYFRYLKAPDIAEDQYFRYLESSGNTIVVEEIE